MEVLLTGNTEYVSPSWIEAAFPEDHVLTTRFSGAESIAGVRAITLDRPSLLSELMETYEFERIVYFSEYLTRTPSGKASWTGCAGCCRQCGKNLCSCSILRGRSA